jgi:hypothetical protein
MNANPKLALKHRITKEEQVLPAPAGSFDLMRRFCG